MSKLPRPSARPLNILVDPRSTGAPPPPRLPDILGLRGTKKG
jgi:hypothetical protein